MSASRYVLPLTIGSADRARRVTGSLAQAEALADLIRDHGHPARVIVGRKRGAVRIRASVLHGKRGHVHWTRPVMLPVDRNAVRTWLGY